MLGLASGDRPMTSIIKQLTQLEKQFRRGKGKILPQDLVYIVGGRVMDALQQELICLQRFIEYDCDTDQSAPTTSVVFKASRVIVDPIASPTSVRLQRYDQYQQETSMELVDFIETDLDFVADDIIDETSPIYEDDVDEDEIEN